MGIFVEALPWCCAGAAALVTWRMIDRSSRRPPWLSGSREWVTFTLLYEPVGSDPYDDMPEALDHDFHHTLEDEAISRGFEPANWIGMIESFRSENGTLNVICIGPDADRMWVALEPIVLAARGLWYDGSVEITYRDGRPREARSLSE